MKNKSKNLKKKNKNSYKKIVYNNSKTCKKINHVSLTLKKLKKKIKKFNKIYKKVKMNLNR